MNEPVKKPLADEILFGKLTRGGKVIVDLDVETAELKFQFVVTPQAEPVH